MQNEQKLYSYYEDLYYGEISFLMMATEEQVSRILQVSNISWFDELGKHSEGYYDFEKYLKLVDGVDVKLLQEKLPHLFKDFAEFEDYLLYLEENEEEEEE